MSVLHGLDAVNENDSEMSGGNLVFGFELAKGLENLGKVQKESVMLGILLLSASVQSNSRDTAIGARRIKRLAWRGMRSKSLRTT